LKRGAARGPGKARPARKKRTAPIRPQLTFSADPARPVAGELFTIRVTADQTNPSRMGLVVCDLSDEEGKAVRQMFFRGTIGPGQTSTVTFRPAATDDQTISIRVIAWDKEHPPQEGDDIRKFLFRSRRSFKFA
jgi:hypothetical protein